MYLRFHLHTVFSWTSTKPIMNSKKGSACSEENKTTTTGRPVSAVKETWSAGRWLENPLQHHPSAGTPPSGGVFCVSLRAYSPQVFFCFLGRTSTPWRPRQKPNLQQIGFMSILNSDSLLVNGGSQRFQANGTSPIILDHCPKDPAVNPI